jgi:hypothetical protein
MRALASTLVRIAGFLATEEWLAARARDVMSGAQNAAGQVEECEMWSA